MERIRRFFRRFGKGLKAKGYTLIEVAAVVAVSATLAAVVVPVAVDKTTEGKIVAAKQDCQGIGGAISGFYKDAGFWPAYIGSAVMTAENQKSYSVLRSGLEVTAVGSAAHDPTIERSGWVTTTPSLVDVLHNHLVIDKPGSTSYAYRTAKVNWKGPYIESLDKRDPWGNNYLVYVKAMHTSSKGATKEYGWVISAGANGILETGPLDATLKGDDIGFVLFAYEEIKG